MTAANAAFDRACGRQRRALRRAGFVGVGARIREWTVYLRDLTLSHRLAADRTRYVYLADSRVVIEELMQKLGARAVPAS